MADDGFDFSLDCPGLKDFEAHLIAMGTTAARAAGRAAWRQATNVITMSARQIVNRRSGLLARSIYTHDKGVQGDNIVFSVDIRQIAFYGKFLEFGTVHARAYPFMRPAVDQSGPEAIRVGSQELGYRIEQQWVGKF